MASSCKAALKAARVLPFRFLLVEELPRSKFCHAAAYLCVRIVEKVKLFVEKKIYIYILKKSKGKKKGSESWRVKEPGELEGPEEVWIPGACRELSPQMFTIINTNS